MDGGRNSFLAQNEWRSQMNSIPSLLGIDTNFGSTRRGFNNHPSTGFEKRNDPPQNQGAARAGGPHGQAGSSDGMNMHCECCDQYFPDTNAFNLHCQGALHAAKMAQASDKDESVTFRKTASQGRKFPPNKFTGKASHKKESETFRKTGTQGRNLPPNKFTGKASHKKEPETFRKKDTPGRKLPPNKFTCKLCEEIFNSPFHLNEHYQGERHKKLYLSKQLEMNLDNFSSLYGDVPFADPPGFTSGLQIPKQTLDQAEKLELYTDVIQQYLKRCYVVAAGRCSVCDKDVQEKDWWSHVLGKKHNSAILTTMTKIGIGNYMQRHGHCPVLTPDRVKLVRDTISKQLYQEKFKEVLGMDLAPNIQVQQFQDTSGTGHFGTGTQGNENQQTSQFQPRTEDQHLIQDNPSTTDFYQNDVFNCRLCGVSGAGHITQHYNSHDHCKTYLTKQTDLGIYEFMNEYGDIPYGNVQIHNFQYCVNNVHAVIDLKRIDFYNCFGVLQWKLSAMEVSTLLVELVKYILRSGFLCDYKCPICGYKLPSAKNWNIHVNSVQPHLENSLEKCNMVGYKDYIKLYGHTAILDRSALIKSKEASATADAKQLTQLPQNILSALRAQQYQSSPEILQLDQAIAQTEKTISKLLHSQQHSEKDTENVEYQNPYHIQSSSPDNTAGRENREKSGIRDRYLSEERRGRSEKSSNERRKDTALWQRDKAPQVEEPSMELVEEPSMAPVDDRQICKLCNVTLDSPEDFNRHHSGFSHKTLYLTKQLDLGLNGFGTVYKDIPFKMLHSDMLVLPPGKNWVPPDVVKMWDKMKLPDQWRKRATDYVTRSASVCRLRCKACNRKFETITFWWEHILGRSHIENCKTACNEIGYEKYLDKYGALPILDRSAVQAMKNMKTSKKSTSPDQKGSQGHKSRSPSIRVNEKPPIEEKDPNEAAKGLTETRIVKVVKENNANKTEIPSGNPMPASGNIQSIPASNFGLTYNPSGMNVPASVPGSIIGKIPYGTGTPVQAQAVLPTSDALVQQQIAVGQAFIKSSIPKASPVPRGVPPPTSGASFTPQLLTGAPPQNLPFHLPGMVPMLQPQVFAPSFPPQVLPAAQQSLAVPSGMPPGVVASLAQLQVVPPSLPPQARVPLQSSQQVAASTSGPQSFVMSTPVVDTSKGTDKISSANESLPLGMTRPLQPMPRPAPLLIKGFRGVDQKSLKDVGIMVELREETIDVISSILENLQQQNPQILENAGIHYHEELEGDEIKHNRSRNGSLRRSSSPTLSGQRWNRKRSRSQSQSPIPWDPTSLDPGVYRNWSRSQSGSPSRLTGIRRVISRSPSRSPSRVVVMGRRNSRSLSKSGRRSRSWSRSPSRLIGVRRMRSRSQSRSPSRWTGVQRYAARSRSRSHDRSRSWGRRSRSPPYNYDYPGTSRGLNPFGPSVSRFSPSRPSRREGSFPDDNRWMNQPPYDRSPPDTWRRNQRDAYSGRRPSPGGEVYNSLTSSTEYSLASPHDRSRSRSPHRKSRLTIEERGRRETHKSHSRRDAEGNRDSERKSGIDKREVKNSSERKEDERSSESKRRKTDESKPAEKKNESDKAGQKKNSKSGISGEKKTTSKDTKPDGGHKTSNKPSKKTTPGDSKNGGTDSKEKAQEKSPGSTSKDRDLERLICRITGIKAGPALDKAVKDLGAMNPKVVALLSSVNPLSVRNLLAGSVDKPNPLKDQLSKVIGEETINLLMKAWSDSK